MNIFDILNAICEAVAAQFKTAPIYINNIAKGFERPSFLVKSTNFTDTDMTNGSFRRHSSFQIVYFAPKNEYDEVDGEMQYAAYIALSQIFQGQAFEVEDRFIKITQVQGAPRDAEVYLTVTFDYVFEGDSPLTPTEAYELMKEINLKYN